MRPWPTQTTSPFPHSCSPRTLIRLFTRSRTACASSETSLTVVNDVHSGFWPAVRPRVIRAVMTERQLVRAAAGGEPEDLVPDADAEHRHLADQLAHGVDEVRHPLGIARAVREEDTVRLHLHHRGRGRRGGNH